MKRVLVFGDAHIPTRRDSIPQVFYAHIAETEYDMALITGDLVREHDMRAALPPLPIHSFFVTGNMDYERKYNFREQVQIEGLSILLLHGTGIRPRGSVERFWEICADVGADIGIHGHTHKTGVDFFKGKLFLNPGTITGATGGWRGKDDASFIEMVISDTIVEVILYKTDWHVVKKSEMSYEKKESGLIQT
jgi:putative phosphoesterase